MTDRDWDYRIVDAVARHLHSTSAIAEILTWNQMPEPMRRGWREEAAVILEIARHTQEEIDAST